MRLFSMVCGKENNALPCFVGALNADNHYFKPNIVREVERVIDGRIFKTGALEFMDDIRNEVS